MGNLMAELNLLGASVICFQKYIAGICMIKINFYTFMWMNCLLRAMTLTGTTTSAQAGPGNNSYKKVIPRP